MCLFPKRRSPTQISLRCISVLLARGLWLSLIVSSLTGGCAPAPAASPPPASTPSEVAGAKLRYAIFPAPPYMIGADETGTALSGIDVDIVQALASQLNVPVETIKCTWARCLELMQSGEADLLSSTYKQPDREAYMRYFDDPYLDQLPIAFYYLTGQPYTLATYSDLYTLPSVGVLAGASYFQRFDSDAAIHKVEVPSQDQLFPMLLRGRVAAIAGYVPTENYRIALEGYQDKVQRSTYTYSETALVYMALSRKSPFLARFDEINRANQQLLSNGQIARIVAAYYDRYR